jgi:hypothetical protein
MNQGAKIYCEFVFEVLLVASSNNVRFLQRLLVGFFGDHWQEFQILLVSRHRKLLNIRRLCLDFIRQASGQLETFEKHWRQERVSKVLWWFHLGIRNIVSDVVNVYSLAVSIFYVVFDRRLRYVSLWNCQRSGFRGI